MQLRRSVLVMVSALAVLVLAAPGGSRASSAHASPTVPLLVGIRAAHGRGYDRVVFDFRGTVPARRTVRYVRRLIADPKGTPVPVAGRAILAVTFRGAAAHTDSGRVTAPGRLAFALPNVMAVVRGGDFEGVVTYGIGLARRARFRVFTLSHPSRVVIDIASSLRTVSRRVYLFNPRRFVANTPPFVTPVARPVPALTPATGLMDRLFAGPTREERAAGLRLLASGATGFADLRIAAGIARVRLTGGCASHGSTATIAAEIMPTLKQLPTVHWVKIYDPAGRTERPTGPVDSIPTCLEP